MAMQVQTYAVTVVFTDGTQADYTGCALFLESATHYSFKGIPQGQTEAVTVKIPWSSIKEIREKAEQ